MYISEVLKSCVFIHLRDSIAHHLGKNEASYDNVLHYFNNHSSAHVKQSYNAANLLQDNLSLDGTSLSHKKPRDVVVIFGPTASGKSALALHLARLLRGAIINGDAMQCYKDVPLLAASPSSEDKAKAPHHLYGFLKSCEHISAMDWAKQAYTAIHEVADDAYIPIIVGGTGFYINSLLMPLHHFETDATKKAQVYAEMAERSTGELYRDLVEYDEEYGRSIHPHHTQRIQRSWAIMRMTGQKIEDLFGKAPLSLRTLYAQEKVVGNMRHDLASDFHEYAKHIPPMRLHIINMIMSSDLNRQRILKRLENLLPNAHESPQKPPITDGTFDDAVCEVLSCGQSILQKRSDILLPQNSMNHHNYHEIYQRFDDIKHDKYGAHMQDDALVAHQNLVRSWPISRVIGFEELWCYAHGFYKKSEVLLLVAQKTAAYARRQRTWMRQKMWHPKIHSDMYDFATHYVCDADQMIGEL